MRRNQDRPAWRALCVAHPSPPGAAALSERTRPAAARARFAADLVLSERDLSSLLGSRKLPAYSVEARPLVVAERAIEILQRRPHRLDGLQHGLQPLAGRAEPARRRVRRIPGWTGGLDRRGGLCGGRLQH